VFLDLGGLMPVGYTELWADSRYGQRGREDVLEGFDGEDWIPLSQGTSVGRRKLDHCPSTPVSQVRVRITQSVGTPLIRKFQVHPGVLN
jgi:alpha-L-fucosidase